MFYAVINHQFKTNDLKNVEKTGNVHFCTICEIIVLVGGP